MNQRVGAKDLIFIVIFSTLIFFGAFFLFSALKKPEVKKQVSVEYLERKINKKVNEKIQKLQTKNRIFKSKIAETGRVDMDEILEEDFDNVESKYELDVYERQVPDVTEVAPQNASERVRVLLDSEDRTLSEKERVLHEYKEQLIEKARQQGWAIEINDDLEVTSAKKL
ncbi:MAG: hypothetical protein ACRBBP_03605 [Bdellovibrionales bacterium]